MTLQELKGRFDEYLEEVKHADLIINDEEVKYGWYDYIEKNGLIHYKRHVSFNEKLYVIKYIENNVIVEKQGVKVRNNFMESIIIPMCLFLLYTDVEIPEHSDAFEIYDLLAEMYFGDTTYIVQIQDAQTFYDMLCEYLKDVGGGYHGDGETAKMLEIIYSSISSWINQGKDVMSAVSTYWEENKNEIQEVINKLGAMNNTEADSVNTLG